MRTTGWPRRNGQKSSPVKHERLKILYLLVFTILPKFNFTASPTGQVPMLTVNGTSICQSGAIERYVAKRAGLIPEDDIEAAKMDMVNCTITDMIDSECLFHALDKKKEFFRTVTGSGFKGAQL